MLFRSAAGGEGEDDAPPTRGEGSQEPVGPGKQSAPAGGAHGQAGPTAHGKPDDPLDVSVAGQSIEIIDFPDSDATAETRGSSAAPTKRARTDEAVDKPVATGIVESPSKKRRLRVPRVPTKPVT